MTAAADQRRAMLSMPLHLARDIVAAAPRDAADRALEWARTHKAVPQDSPLLRAACRLVPCETPTGVSAWTDSLLAIPMDADTQARSKLGVMAGLDPYGAEQRQRYDAQRRRQRAVA